MEKNSFARKIFIEGAISIAIVVVLLSCTFFFMNRIKSIANEISSTRRELAMRSRMLNLLASLRTDYRTKIAKYFNVLYAYVPVEEQLFNLRQEFLMLAARADLGVSYVYLSESPASKAAFGAYNFRLDMTGEYDKLLSFIETLQDFKYLSNFQAYTITNYGSKSTMGVNGTVYFREEAEEQ